MDGLGSSAFHVFPHAYLTALLIPLAISFLKAGFTTGAPATGFFDWKPVIIAIVLGALVWGVLSFFVFLADLTVGPLSQAPTWLSKVTAGIFLHLFLIRDAKRRWVFNLSMAILTCAFTAAMASAYSKGVIF